MPKQTGGDITVFRRDLVQNDIDCALDEWDCLCDKKNAPCGCKIKLSWSTDIRDFTNNRTIAEATSVTTGYNGNECWLNCDKSKILLNNSREFYQVESDGYRKYFPYNNSLEELEAVVEQISSNETNEHNIYNLCDILIHEIGHLYGLAHYDEYHCPPDISSGIMNSTFESNKPKKGLSLDDKCAFMKWMCLSYVPVEEEISEQKSQFNYPNPFENFTIIKFNIDCEAPTKFNVYNQYGINVLSYEKVYQRGENTEYFDGSVLPCGIYYYTIENNGKLVSNKMIILK